MATKKKSKRVKKVIKGKAPKKRAAKKSPRSSSKDKKKATASKPAKTKVKKKAARRKTRLPIINFKATPGQKRVILANAKRYALGNYSKWLREAGMRYRPKRA